MYTVKGKYWMVRNGEKVPAAADVTFRTAMGMLRWALDNRMIRRGTWGNGAPGPREMERVSIPYSGSGDWQGDHYFTPAQVEAMGRALSRYRAILRHYREIEPGWRPDTSVSPDGTIHYADNSIELHEISRDGQRRHRMTLAPSGDACF